MSPHLTPSADLLENERVQQSFTADRATYIRTNTWLAAAAMLGGMVVLWLLGNPYIWTGAVGGLAAIALRGAYLMSDELAMRWDLTNQRLLGPGGRIIALENIDKINTMGSFVQVITRTGDKHLIKYQVDPEATVAALNAYSRAP